MSTQEQRAEYLRQSEATRQRFTPTGAQTWQGDALTDALIAVDLVANTVMTEAKKNPVQHRESYLGYPAMNSYLFGQTTHDVGKAVMDELIRAGWTPASRVREPGPRPAPVDLSWVTTEPSHTGARWSWVAILVAAAVAGILIAAAITELMSR